MQRRRLCQAATAAAASAARNNHRRPSSHYSAAAGGVDGGGACPGVVGMHRRRTGPVGAENHPPSRFPRDDDEDDDGRPSRRHHRRFFSSTSAADEVVVAIKEDPPPGAAPESATATATAAATDSRERWRHRPETAGIDVVVVDDDDGGGSGVVPGSEEFARAWSECRASLPALDDGAASPDEVADRLLALLYSPEFERQVLMAGGEGGGVLPSRARIHHALLRTVDRCLPSPEARTSSSGEAGGGAPSSPDDRRRGGIMAYSAATVGRALRLARRAEELGLPPHRPLYRRLAVGVVLASPSPSSSSLVPPVDSPLGGEGRPIAAPPPFRSSCWGSSTAPARRSGSAPGRKTTGASRRTSCPSPSCCCWRTNGWRRPRPSFAVGRMPSGGRPTRSRTTSRTSSARRTPSAPWTPPGGGSTTRNSRNG